MNQTNPDYTFGTASLEIILLSLGAFLLGMLLCWLLRKMGVCCKPRVSEYSYQPDYAPRDVSTGTGMGEKARNKREFPAAPNAGSYTADLNHLLRDSSTPSTPVSPSPRSMETASAKVGTATTVAAATLLSTTSTAQKDDLKKLEGIGPKIEQLLNAAGIQSYYQLAAMSADDIKPILEAAGSQFKMHDPKSWPYQAELAAKDDWDRLKEYQNLLINGTPE
jgi:predicted flap endonuclease-1-like 5' DNA nuclease